MTPTFPKLGTDPVPTDIYWQPEWYEKEIEAIYKRAWLHLASEHEVPKPGDFVVKDIPTLRHKLIVVRGKDQRVRVFQNVCTHRGSEVELRDKGNCKVFTCPFHGWSFDHQGKLVGLPSAKHFFDLDRDEHGLIEVNSDIWEHHVFVNFDPKPEQSLEEYLGDFGHDLAGWPGWERCTVSWEYQAEVNVNWKLLLDAFNEVYHVPLIHRNSVVEMFSTPELRNGEILASSWKYPHRSYSGPGNHSYEPTPGQLLGWLNNPAQTATSGGGSSDDDGITKGLNPGEHRDWSYEQPTFFPNWALIVTPQTYFTHTVWPIAPGKSRWLARSYSYNAKTFGERFGQEHSNIELRDTLMEDANTFERVQHALEAGLVPFFTFQDHEICCRMQYNTVKEWVETWEKGLDTPAR
jgi:phenylpropionate dioxygenase-like ring-hydroxylating dioxygenase large terminal subunit